MHDPQLIIVSPSRFWQGRGIGNERPSPRPFKVRLDPAISHVWAGVVHEPGHEFDGQIVYLSQRRVDWTGEVDVEVSPATQDAYRRGYGYIRPRPSWPPITGTPVEVRPTEGATLAHYERLIALWARPEHAHGRVVSHGEAEVASLEAHYGIRLPADFCSYLLYACSTLDDGGDMDGFHNAWWGLERIRSLIEECGEEHDPSIAVAAGKALLFADTLVWCTAWAICCGEGPDYGRVFLVTDRSRFVADSFGEFVERYVDDDKSLY